MSVHSTQNPRKRKRRRGPDKPPLPAQLVFDNRLEGDICLVSEDLFIDLFPAYHTDHSLKSSIHHVAMSAQQPWISQDDSHNTQWTILPVRSSASAPSPLHDLSAHSVHIPASSLVAPVLLEKLSAAARYTGKPVSRAPIDIRVLDVVPTPLETVVVNLEYHGKKHTTNLGEYSQDIIEQAVARRLQDVTLVSAGMVLEVGPLDRQNVKVTVQICEPVDQGYIIATTKLVITGIARKSRRPKQAPAKPLRRFPAALLEDDGEDTSNEQFFSAVEGPQQSPARTVKKARLPSVNVQTSDSESEDEETDLSGDEGEAIGLSLPGLPGQPSGSLSARSIATPRVGMFGNGTLTPGSVYSSFSTSTVRAGDVRGRDFQVKQLIRPVADAILHPRPTPDEDNEARVYTDSSSLAKLGCFSGEWVRLEVPSDDPFSSLNSLTTGLETHSPLSCRVAKIYAIPILSDHRPKYIIDRSGRRTSSSSYNPSDRPPSTVFMSPIMFANLGQSAKVLISAVPAPPTAAPSRSGRQQQRMPASSLPLVAKEVSLVKIAAPIATEREVQDALVQQLRSWFQSKKRLIKTGDLIPLILDEDVSRAMYRGSAAEADSDQSDLEIVLQSDREGSGQRLNVVWFKVGAVATDSVQKDDEDQELPDYWAGTTLVKPSSTRMTHSGSEQAKYPSTMANQWQHYLGLKSSGRGSDPLDVMVSAKPDVYVSQTRRRLRELISAATSPQAVHFKLPPIAILMVSTQRHIGKATSVYDACADLGIHVFDIDGYDVLSEDSSGGSDTKTVATLEARAERAMSCGTEHTALLIRHVDVLTAERMSSTIQHILSTVRVLIATTTAIDKVPEGVRSLFTHEIEMTAPDEAEREGLLRSITSTFPTPLAPDVSLSSVAVKTAALVAGDLVDVVARASIARLSRLELLASTATTTSSLSSSNTPLTVTDILLAGGSTAPSLTTPDFTTAVDAARKNFADSIGAPKIPNVSWSDVGGLAHVKSAVMETIQLPLERPELFAKGMKKRSGILFYGPPGTGKTLLAKAIATEFSLNFFSVKGPELLNMYIGESEANVRRVFQRARDARPCVVFFDELDSVAPKRGNQGDSGGVMDRIVSQLLAELDGMSGGEGGGTGVFVIGATNRPDLLDQALLRPGRFDKMLYLGVSDTHEKQHTILSALTRKFTLAPQLDLKSVADTLPFTYTGADLYALCADAMLKAITRRASAVDVKVKQINESRKQESPPKGEVSVAWFFDHAASEEDVRVVVEAEDFEGARRELVPSVSVKELEHYERVRRTFEEGGEEKEKKKENKRAGMGMQQRIVPLREKPGVHGDGEDGIVERTQALSLNGGGHGGGKGKGKAVVRPEIDSFGDATNGDEGLYE